MLRSQDFGRFEEMGEGMDVEGRAAEMGTTGARSARAARTKSSLEVKMRRNMRAKAIGKK